MVTLRFPSSKCVGVLIGYQLAGRLLRSDRQVLGVELVVGPSSQPGGVPSIG